ncbi:uncharacterized protein [Amphiura filiformis]|uniref:uncharacterized protein n=1 Tax=Amphiura filiformis TaxID=82378 RepID=UPI003B223B06
MAADRNDEVANVNGLEANDIEMDQEQCEQGGNGDSLREFIQQRYQEQKDAGNLSSSEGVSDERTNQFFQRAISESQRMSTEVARSEQRQQELYRELGAHRVHAWTMEHASEVTVTLQDNNGQMPSSQQNGLMNGH